MSLKGNLSSVNLTEIFQMLSLSGREGTLFIYEGSRKQAICFTKEGVSIRSRERNENNLLGKILIRFGRVTEQDLRRAIQERRASNRLLGDCLVDLGACAREDVEDAFAVQSEEDIRDLFLNKSEAQFEYIDGYFPEDDGPTIPYVTLNVNSLLIEIARRSDEWEYIRRRIRGPREIYRFTDAEGALEEEVLEDCYAHRINPLIDGTHSVADLIDLSYVNKFEVCKLLSAFLDAELIEPVPPEALRQSARSALRAGDAARAIRHYQYLMSMGDYPLEVVAEAAEAHEGIRDYQEAAALVRRYAEELVREGDVRGALEALRRVAGYPQPDPEALGALLDLAFEEPKLAADFSQPIMQAGKALAAHLISSDQRADALALLDRLVRTFPDEITFAVSLVNIHYEAGNVTRAVQECERLAKNFIKLRRPSPAVSLYKRLLVMDPERHDVRDKIRKLGSGRRRRRRSGLPRFAIVVALLLVMGGVGFVYLNPRGATSGGKGTLPKSVLDDMVAKLAAEQGLAEEHGDAAIQRFEALTSKLEGDVIQHRESIRNGIKEAQRRLEQFESSATRARSIARTIIKHEAKSEHAMRARAVSVALDDRNSKVRAAYSTFYKAAMATAIRITKKGKALYKQGQQRPALARFVLARDLAARSEKWIESSLLNTYIENIRDNITRAEADLRFARSREEDDDFPAAIRSYLKLMEEFGESDIVSSIRLPVEIISTPRGAAIFVGEVEVNQKAPTFVRITPFEETTFTLRKEGFKEDQFRVGPFMRKGIDPDRFRYVRTLLKAARWVRDVGARIESDPVIFSGRVAVAGRNGRYKVFDVTDGRELATGTIQTLGGISAGLASDGKRFYIPALDGTLHVFDARTFKPLQGLKGFKTGLYATPTIHKGRLYIVDHDGQAWAYKVSNLKQPLWSKKTDIGVRARPIIDGQNLIIVTVSGHVSVLDKDTGTKAGEYQLRGRFTVPPTSTGNDGQLVFASEDGTLHFVDKISGKARRKPHKANGSIQCRLVIRGRSLFLPLKEDELLEIDTRTEETIVHRTQSEDPGAVAASNRMFFVQGRKLVAFGRRADGSHGVAWTFLADGRISAGPVVQDGSVYVGDVRGKLYRLDTGE